MNLQPSEAEAGFDIRVPPTADLESLEKRIAEEWAPASRNMTFEVGISCLISQRDVFLLISMIQLVIPTGPFVVNFDEYHVYLVAAISPLLCLRYWY